MRSGGITKARVGNTQASSSIGVWNENWTPANKLMLSFPGEMAINICLFQIGHQKQTRGKIPLKADLEKE